MPLRSPVPGGCPATFLRRAGCATMLTSSRSWHWAGHAAGKGTAHRRWQGSMAGTGGQQRPLGRAGTRSGWWRGRCAGWERLRSAARFDVGLKCPTLWLR